MEFESETDETSSEEVLSSISFDECSVDNVEDIMSHTKICTSGPPVTQLDMIDVMVDSAAASTGNGNDRYNDEEQLMLDSGDFEQVNDGSASRTRRRRRTRRAPQRWWNMAGTAKAPIEVTTSSTLQLMRH